MRGKVRHAVLIGRDAPKLEATFRDVCTTERAADMRAAVGAARAAAQPGDTVLLSPACASLDMFRDYAHRGDEFAAAVRTLQDDRRYPVLRRSTGHPRRLSLDPWVFGPVAALLLVGLVMVASASIGVSDREMGAPFFYFQRQLMFVGLGLVAATIAMTIPTAVWEKYSMVLLGWAWRCW